MKKQWKLTPAAIWSYDKEVAAVANVNRPVAGPTFDQRLPVGNATVTALFDGNA
jgi:hypothetical protein